MDNISVEDIVLLVFTSAKNLHERALSVQNTWLKNFPNGYLIGGYCKDKKLKMINIDNAGEDYLSATYKQYIGLKIMYEKFPNAKWFYITGCDAYVYSNNLCSMLSKYDSSKDYFIGGHCRYSNIDGTKVFFPAGGPGFCLSSSLVKKLIPKIDFILSDFSNYKVFKNGSCDVSLAYYLMKFFSIKVTVVPGFYHYPPYKYPGETWQSEDGSEITESVVSKPIAFHCIKIREMYRLYSGRKLYKKNRFFTFVDFVERGFVRKLHTKYIINFIWRAIYRKHVC
ncbi:MAG: hypothetical protein J5647_03425 [Spirochaetaceae bacterium]|nr:hypothetical protein [Spirochaetaceae bacterium]